METINSMASSAAKVIWGENDENNSNNNSNYNNNTAANKDTTTATTSTATDTMNNETKGQEPVSGVLGDTSKGQPFDAGNMEPGAAPVTETAETVESKGPTTEQPSTTGDTSFKAAQADIRDPESNPTADPRTEAERQNVDDTGALDKSENPAKVDGPGPRPVEEVAAEHGGDAGKSNMAAAGANKTDTLGGEGGDAVDDKETKESKGSGEQYVKSSGLQADGGDFDATKPGAGREADRLMGEKGLANPAAAAASGKKPDESEEAEHADEPAGSPGSVKEKKSLKEKIKAKLHKN